MTTPPPSIAYSRPTTLAAAIAALRRPGACAFAGGTDLLVALRHREAHAAWIRELVDIKAVAEASGIGYDGTTLRIGALTTASALLGSALVRRHAPALHAAARATAAPLIRRRGTVGGNLVTRHEVPDVATALLALRATVEVVGSRGARRRVAIDRFLARPRASGAEPLVLAVHVPAAGGSAFEKLFARRGFSRAIVAAAVALHDRRATVAIAGIATTPQAARLEASALGSARLADALHRAIPALRDAEPARRRAAIALARRAVERLA